MQFDVGCLSALHSRGLISGVALSGCSGDYRVRPECVILPAGTEVQGIASG